jgi:RHS repeat-associated protein
MYYIYTYDPMGNYVQRQSVADYSSGYYALDTAEYDAYGTCTADIRTTTGAAMSHTENIGYGGQWGNYYDYETGLLSLGHRYYDPATGRFINRDPIGYDGGINLYGYCGNNPVNGVDPAGEDALIFWSSNFTDPDPKEREHWRDLANDYASSYDKDLGNIVSGDKAYVVGSDNGLTFADIQKAFQTHTNIDTIIYVGHAGAPAVYYRPHTGLYPKDVDKLDTTNVLPYATIELIGCDTAGTTARGQENIAQAFANHFGTDVYGFIGGLSFGCPVGPKGNPYFTICPAAPRSLPFKTPWYSQRVVVHTNKSE